MLVRFLRLLVHTRSLVELVERQNDLIHILEAENVRAELEHVRSTRDLVGAFIAALDDPDEVVRERLFAGHADLCDHVARLEEHIT